MRWSMAVREVKDEVARGAIGDGDRWERDGMRLVWQGRIIRDEERVGEVVGNVGIAVIPCFEAQQTARVDSRPLTSSAYIPPCCSSGSGKGWTGFRSNGSTSPSNSTNSHSFSPAIGLVQVTEYHCSS